MMRLIFKTSSVTPGFLNVFNIILSFSNCSQSFKKICTWELLGANVLKLFKEYNPMTNFLYDTRPQGMMVVVFIKTNIESKMMTTMTMIPCGRISAETGHYPINHIDYDKCN